MKLYVDIPAETLTRATDAVARGGYRTLSDLVLLALENQISQELQGSTSTQQHRKSSDVSGRSQQKSGRASPVVKILEDGNAIMPSREALGRSVADYGWLWGLINRVFPIKVAARNLMQISRSGIVPLEDAKESAASYATEIAASLTARGAGSATRDESILIGLPAREPLFRAKQRFADHFVGRIDGSTRPWGALFELGLAGIAEDKRSLIGLTALGRRFAELENPVLDGDSKVLTLTEAETNLYMTEIVPAVERELQCFRTLLAGLRTGTTSTDHLQALTIQALGSSTSPESARSQQTAAIGRLRELGLIKRERLGREITFSATSKAESYLLFLNGVAGSELREQGDVQPEAQP